MRIISQLHGEAKRRRAEVGGLLTVNGAPGGMTPRRAAPQAAQFDFLIKPSEIYDACDIIRRLKLSDHISVTLRWNISTPVVLNESSRRVDAHRYADRLLTPRGNQTATCRSSSWHRHSLSLTVVHPAFTFTEHFAQAASLVVVGGGDRRRQVLAPHLGQLEAAATQRCSD